jgi:hypothetical protein
LSTRAKAELAICFFKITYICTPSLEILQKKQIKSSFCAVLFCKSDDDGDAGVYIQVFEGKSSINNFKACVCLDFLVHFASFFFRRKYQEIKRKTRQHLHQIFTSWLYFQSQPKPQRVDFIYSLIFPFHKVIRQKSDKHRREKESGTLPRKLSLSFQKCIPKASSLSFSQEKAWRKFFSGELEKEDTTLLQLLLLLYAYTYSLNKKCVGMQGYFYTNIYTYHLIFLS